MITNSNEYLAQLQAIQNSSVTTYTVAPSSEPRFLINANTRTIDIPSEFGFLAVQHDHKAETIYFEIARYFDHVDLSTKTCIVQFLNKDNKDLAEGYYRVDSMDITSVEDKIVFGWNIENKSTRLSGDIIFSIRFYSIDSNGNFTYNFNTIPVQSKILDTLDVVNSNSNVEPSEFEEWIARLDELDKKLDEKIANLEVGTIDTDETLSVEGKAADAKAVGDALSTVNNQIEELKENGTGTGLSDDLKSALKSFFTNVQTLIPQLAFVTSENVGYTVIANAKSIVTALDSTGGESGGEEEPDTPTEPENPEVTLSSISASYTGGNVTVGTDLTSLTGITVKATYSDGTTKTVTGYTLSGTIAEGENTITVSYGGKTTTFTVIGVAESGGEVSEILYELPEATVFDGTNSITTDVMLNDTDKDYSIVIDYTFDIADMGGKVISNDLASSMIGFRLYNGYTAATNKTLMMYNGTYGSPFTVNLGTEGKQTIKAVFVHTAGVNEIKANGVINGKRDVEGTVKGAKEYTSNTMVAKIGIDGFIGTINDLKIYNRVLTSEEIEAYLA